MYPSVYKVGEYLDEKSYSKQRIQVAGWVHNKNIVDTIQTGLYENLFPVHIEVCTTYSCNFNCPWCNCRESMRSYPSVMNYELIEKIVKSCSEHDIGIQWTGGEPLKNAATIRGILYASLLDVKQCLFTNGSLLDANNIKLLLGSNLKFVRISLNTSNVNAHSNFHGGIRTELSRNVLDNIDVLCEQKQLLRSNVKIGLSIVLDSINLDFFEETLEYIYSVAKKYPLTLNYVVVRAVNSDFKGIRYTKKESFDEQYKRAISQDAIKKLKDELIEVILPNEIDFSYTITKENLGCQTFSEIAPDGNMFLCSDKYGDRAYMIGNVENDSLEGICNSNFRKEQMCKHKYCYRNGNCPRYSRGWYFNMLFDQIEHYREKGQMEIVNDWIRSLQIHVPNEGHSFFI